MNKPKPEVVCEEIMELLLKDGYTYQVSMKDVEKAIWQVRGQNKETVRQWTKVLLGFEYLKQVNKDICEINVAKIPHLATLLRRIPQTRIS